MRMKQQNDSISRSIIMNLNLFLEISFNGYTGYLVQDPYIIYFLSNKL